MGANTPTFCQDGALHFVSVDEQVIGSGGGGSSKSSEKYRAWPDNTIMFREILGSRLYLIPIPKL